MLVFLPVHHTPPPPTLPHISAVIEHTNRVIFLEDDDVAAVSEGRLSIHRIKRRAGDYPARAIQTLQMELQQIMKGESGRSAFYLVPLLKQVWEHFNRSAL